MRQRATANYIAMVGTDLRAVRRILFHIRNNKSDAPEVRPYLVIETSRISAAILSASPKLRVLGSGLREA
jgi:hypothetical protein